MLKKIRKFLDNKHKSKLLLKFISKNRVILLVLFLSFIFKLYVITDFTVVCCPSDAGTYTKIAKNIVQTGEFVYTYNDDHSNWTDKIYGAKPPLYPYFLAIWYRIFGLGILTESIVKVIQIFMSILTAFLIYLSTKQIFSKEAGIMSLILYSFFWETIIMAGALYSETMYLFLISSLIYIVINITRKPIIFSILTGINLGMLILVRPVSLIIIFPIALFLFSRKFLREFSKRGLIIIIFMLLAVAPWTLRNYQIYKQFVFIYTDGAINFWMGNNPQAGGLYEPPLPDNPGSIPILISKGPQQEVERDHFYTLKAINYIKTEPARALDVGFAKIFLSTNIYRPAFENTTNSRRAQWLFSRPNLASIDRLLIYMISFEFALIEIFSLSGLLMIILSKGLSKERIFIIMFSAVGLFVIFLTYSDVRYIIQLYPMMMILSGPPLYAFIKQFRLLPKPN